MKCHRINKGIICLSKTEFNCPHCGKEFDDSKDIYLNRINRNKSGITRIKCECREYFGMTYDITGDAVSFKLSTKKSNNLFNV